MTAIKLLFTTLCFGLFMIGTSQAQTDTKTTTTVKKSCCAKGCTKACCAKKDAKACCKKGKKGKKCDHASAGKACDMKATAPDDKKVDPTNGGSKSNASESGAGEEELNKKGGPERKIAITEEGIPMNTGSKEKMIKGTGGTSPK